MLVLIICVSYGIFAVVLNWHPPLLLSLVFSSHSNNSLRFISGHKLSRRCYFFWKHVGYTFRIWVDFVNVFSMLEFLLLFMYSNWKSMISYRVYSTKGSFTYEPTTLYMLINENKKLSFVWKWIPCNSWKDN